MHGDTHEIELRAHIRNLLFDYTKIHLTTDYITFTENIVSQILSESLSFAPATDPNSLTLPEEPFDTLIRTLRLFDLQPYTEIWTADRDALQLLRNNISLQVKPRTERCWNDEDEFDYSTSIYRPMSPVLTNRAIRQTPKLGSGTCLISIPKSQDDVVKAFKRVEPETLEEPHIKLEEALCIRLAIDSATHASIRSLFESVPTLFPPTKPHANTHIDTFMRTASPPLSLPKHEFIPLFARGDQLGRMDSVMKPIHHSTPHKLSDLPLMLPEITKIDDEDRDLYKQHMVVVDGWQTFAPSSPSSISTPSLGSGTSDVDELFMISPPGNQQPLIQELMASRIDETEISRSRKIGKNATKYKPIGSNQSLGSFISTFVTGSSTSKVDTSHPRIVTTPRSSPCNSIGLSVLGQPSSLLEDTRVPPTTGKDGEEEEIDVDVIVHQLYSKVGTGDPADLILHEKLDERGGELMDTPNMPQPNVHSPTTMYLPTDMQTLIQFPAHKTTKDDLRASFKKVLGLKSLNMELSWRPFQFGPKIPTNEEVAAVEGTILDATLGDVDNLKVTQLLEDTPVLSFESINGDVFRSWGGVDDNVTSAILKRVERSETMLTREERKRLSRGFGGTVSGDQTLLSADSATTHPVANTPPEKCRKMLDVKASQPSLACVSTDPNDNNFGSNLLTINDSGVSIVLPMPAIDNGHSQDQCSDGDEDKENRPPLIVVPALHQAQDRFSFATHSEDTWHVEFQPLSFDSNHSYPSELPQLPLTGKDSIDRTPESAKHFQSRSHSPDSNSRSISAAPITTANSVERSHNTNFSSHPNSSNKTTDSTSRLMNPNFAGRSLTDFLTWRHRPVKLDSSNPAPSLPTDNPNSNVMIECGSPKTNVPPDTIFDQNTLLLPSPWLLPSTAHRYLASVDMIQKRSIVRFLGMKECAVEIVERETLDGVDLVLDPYTAVIFTSLLALPSQCEALTSILSKQSWRYSRLLVIFEAFPSLLASKINQGPTRLAPNAYTPPTLKAIKKVRRDLGIAEAFQTKNAQTSVHFAFANSVGEAAMFTRCFGDCAEANDNTGGTIWGTRPWLDIEVQEDEQDLADVDGMNVFAALIILCQKSLHDFLDLTPETRMIEFGHLVGGERLFLFNEVLEHRYQVMQSHISSSP